MNNTYKKTKLGWIPKEWEVVKLGNVAKINENTLSNSTDDNYQFYYIDLSAVKNGNIDFPSQKISFKNAPSRARRKLNQDDLILATVRPNLLGYAFVNFNPNHFICSTGFAIITPIKEKSKGQFLYQLLYSNIIQNQIDKLIVGSNYPAINSSDVSGLKIPLPPLPEQKKIAKILSTVDAKINNISDQITETQQLKKGLMQQLLTEGIGHSEFKESKMGKIPRSWEVVKLGEVIQKIIGGGTPFRDNADYWNGEIPWATVKDLKSNILHNTQEYITQEGLENSAANLIPKQTLIIATRMALGKAVLFSKAVSINQDLKAIFPKKNLSKKYLFHWFYANAERIDKMGSGSTVKGIRLESLKSIEIRLPSIEEQQKITQILDKIDVKLSNLEELHQEYHLLKKGLMQVLLTGKVRTI